MRDHPMNDRGRFHRIPDERDGHVPENPSETSPAELGIHNDLDVRIDAALSALPAVSIPAGFASRVASCVPAASVPSIQPTNYGRRFAYAALALLVVALLIVARQASPYASAAEWILCAELILLALGTVWWRPVQSSPE